MLKLFNDTIQTLNSKLCKVLTLIIPAILLLNLANLSVSVHAIAGEGLFKAASSGIYEIVALVVTFIVIPVGVIALVILIVQVILGMVSGETHQLGKKIGWGIAILILFGIAIYIRSNATTIFS